MVSIMNHVIHKIIVRGWWEHRVIASTGRTTDPVSEMMNLRTVRLVGASSSSRKGGIDFFDPHIKVCVNVNNFFICLVSTVHENEIKIAYEP
jgi:hypothetical protein